MGSPQNAALRHRLSSIRAAIQSLQTDLLAASPIAKPDIELMIRWFEDAENNAKNELELHELTNGGIEARKEACSHPERFITNAPKPPSSVFDRTPPAPRPQRSREEMIESKIAELELELRKAEARSSELKKAIDGWYLHAVPKWVEVTADARTRWTDNQRLTIEQLGALKLQHDQMLEFQDYAASSEHRERDGVATPLRAFATPEQVWKAIGEDMRLRHKDLAEGEWRTQHANEVALIKPDNLEARIEMEIALADKHAQTLLDIGHAVADKHAIKGNRAFYRALFTYCLIQTFAGRQSGVEGELTRRDLTTNRAGNSKPALSHFTDEMTSLSKRWENKLEILIRDSETRDRVARERETQPTLSIAPTVPPLPDSTSQRKQEGQSGPGTNGNDSFSVSKDFLSVRFKGTEYPLTFVQGQMMKVLWEAYQCGHPVVGKARLLAATERETSQVRDTWRNSPLWNLLIVSAKKGSYRLNLPKQSTVSQ
jgi:hypothetical protein